MGLPTILQNLRIPAVGAPLFIVSGPELVIAQCKAGIVGSFPALNAREKDGDPIALDAWLTQITQALDAHNQANPDRPAAPFAVNQIVHPSNTRLQRDVEICMSHKVPIWITSMGAREDVNEAAHACGAIALHDVVNNRHAQKAIDKGADGLIAVAAGAGGHAGPQSPFALTREIRDWFDGTLLLSGAIATGEALLAARALGADLGYIGSPFIATREANAGTDYKEMIVAGGAQDIVNSDAFTGYPANYLRGSIARAGLDPNNPVSTASLDVMDEDTSAVPKAWRDIWGAGQGIGAIKEISTTEDIVARLEREYRAAGMKLAKEFK